MNTDNIDTEALRALEAKATPAPWGKTPFEEKNDVCIWRPDGKWLANVGNWGNCQLIVEGEDGPEIQAHPDLERIETGHDANAEFIVAIRNAAPALLATIEAQRKEIEELRVTSNAQSYALSMCREVMAESRKFIKESVAERDALKAEVERLRALCADTLDWFDLPGAAVEERGLAARIRAALRGEEASRG